MAMNNDQLKESVGLARTKMAVLAAVGLSSVAGGLRHMFEVDRMDVWGVAGLAVGYLAVLRFKHVEESAENMIEEMNDDT